MPESGDSSEEEEQEEDHQEEEKSDDDDSDEEVEMPRSTPVPKRSQEHDPYEGRSIKRPPRIERIDEEPSHSQIKSRDRTDRSRSPVKTRSPVKNWEQALEHDPDNESLLETWNRTGTIGKGKEILERKEAVTDALLAFLGARKRSSLPRTRRRRKEARPYPMKESQRK